MHRSGFVTRDADLLRLGLPMVVFAPPPPLPSTFWCFGWSPQVVLQFHKPIEAQEIKSRDGLSRRLRQASVNLFTTAEISPLSM